MSAIDDGGPAFPGIGGVEGHGNYTPVQMPEGDTGWAMVSQGMTLRDWFAGQALAGLCASTSHDDAPSKKLLADYAWQQSDAMLAARKGGSND